MSETHLELLSSSGAPPDLWVLDRLHLREAFGRPFEAELEIHVREDGGLSDDTLDELLRQPALVRYGHDGMSEVHGIFRSISMDSTHDPRSVTYRLHLVPRMWELSQIRRSRVFQDASVVDIANMVLAELGLTEKTRAVEWRLRSSYPVSEYTVQYQESDLDFLHRLLEHHGIFYFFEHPADGDLVVFADDNSALIHLEDHETVTYSAVSTNDNPSVTHLSRELTPQPTAVVLREYNWRTPSVALQSDAAVDQVTGRGFENRYGEHFKDPGAGNALAAARAERLLARRDVYRGTCRIAELRPGHRFDLVGHPFSELDQTYAVTSVEMTVDRGADAAGGLAHENRFTAIPHEVRFRPELRTPKPKIEGVMHARVDGAVPGSAAPIDEWGRYKILFPFDLAGQPGGSASRWVRLAQPASGPGFGIHFPLHIGAEVAVAHLDGDPDRPIIMNSPPNTETVTPVNSVNPTQSAIRTQAGIQLIWDDDC